MFRLAPKRGKFNPRPINSRLRKRSSNGKTCCCLYNHLNTLAKRADPTKPSVAFGLCRNLYFQRTMCKRCVIRSWLFYSKIISFGQASSGVQTCDAESCDQLVWFYKQFPPIPPPHDSLVYIYIHLYVKKKIGNDRSEGWENYNCCMQLIGKHIYIYIILLRLRDLVLKIWRSVIAEPSPAPLCYPA